MAIGNMCRREVVSVKPGVSVKVAAQLMEDKNVGCVVVVEGGKPIGILTDRDILLRVVNRGLDPAKCSAEQVMSRDVVSLKEDMGLFEALEHTKERGIRRFPVVDSGGELQGIITLDDILYILGKEMADVASIIEKESPRL